MRNAPHVGAIFAIGPLTGLSRSTSDILATTAIVASRALLNRSRYSFLVKNPESRP